jgi:hypothetical protein
MTVSKLVYSKVSNIEVDGINHADHPDYSDAFIISADYDGRPMTEDEINELNEDREFVFECVWESIF